MQVVDQEWTRTLKAMNIPPFPVVNLGLQISSMKIIEFNLFSRNFDERNQLILSAESCSEARSK